MSRVREPGRNLRNDDSKEGKSVQKSRDSYDVLYAEHQRVLHELNDLKSGKTYTDLKAQVAAAEKRAQEAEEKAAKEANLRAAADRKADSAFKKGYDEGIEQAVADRKEMYARRVHLVFCENDSWTPVYHHVEQRVFEILKVL